MPITVRVYASLREKLGWNSRELNTEGSCKLSNVLSHLSDLKKVFEEFGQENFTILLNGRNIRTLDGLETSVLDGDVLDIFPPAGGGCTLC